MHVIRGRVKENFELLNFFRPKLVGNYLSTNSNFSHETMNEFIPPEDVRDMVVLDRNKFTKIFKIPTLEIKNSDLGKVKKYLKKYFVKLENFKPIQISNMNKLYSIDIEKNEKNDDFKVAYFNPTLVKKWIDISDSDRECLMNLDISENDFKLSDLEITYDNWKSEDIFRAILPSDLENVTGYSIIGHIIHLNLRDHHLKYKDVIGQVLLDKVKNCTTVINKTTQIDNTYRNFSFELVCGEKNFITCVKENKCNFEFDFSQVYWNPRLCTEHDRMNHILKCNDILFDVFAGVGPFAIPASKKGCVVYANDLNPESYKWLNHNSKINKLDTDKFKTYNLDGEEFIKKILPSLLMKNTIDLYNNVTSNSKIHITMNLPATAPTFLRAFCNILKNVSIEELNLLPTITHVYCFVTSETPQKSAQEMISQNIGFDINDKVNEIIYVRNVAPNKEMIRVSFLMPYTFLCENISSQLDKRKVIDITEDEPKAKLCKF